MTCVTTLQSRCRGAIARGDITPPFGIYHRMWGAALHYSATGVHRPLEATLLWLAPLEGTDQDAQLLVGLDHCILDTQELQRLRLELAEATGLTADRVQISLSHTHGSGWMSRTRSGLPGGELIGPYLDELATRLVDWARPLPTASRPLTLVYGTGRCALAAHRDFRDPERDLAVCGLNPTGPADETLLVIRAVATDGLTIATVVNYACHPTTLAWQNTLISPDWVGAMRAVVEQAEGAPCLFLQGASGDLGPREGFVGDPAVADRNGRQVGYAALSTLAGLPPAGTEYRYLGPVVSGATIGAWAHQPVDPSVHASHTAWSWRTITVDLPYRHDLPTIEQTRAERTEWEQREAAARTKGHEAELRLCRAQIEQRTRQLTRLQALHPGLCCPLPVTLGELGDALWILLPGELYQSFQTTLRARFAPRPVIVATLTNDWQPGYIPPAASFGYGIYQEIIAATAPGCHEILIEAITRALQPSAGRSVLP